MQRRNEAGQPGEKTPKLCCQAGDNGKPGRFYVRLGDKKHYLGYGDDPKHPPVEVALGQTANHIAANQSIAISALSSTPSQRGRNGGGGLMKTCRGSFRGFVRSVEEEQSHQSIRNAKVSLYFAVNEFCLLYRCRSLVPDLCRPICSGADEPRFTGRIWQILC